MKKLLPVVVLFLACSKSKPQLNPIPLQGDRFSNVPLNYVLTRPIPEASGIADSKTVNEHLWVIEDSGNPARLFLLKHEGFVTDSVNVTGAVNRDWEDVAVGKGPDDSKTYLYIADIGDNNAQYPSYTIYRMEEPKNFTVDVTEYDKLEFTYPDGSHDAEAIMIDNNTKDIYVITKRDAASKIYKIPYPQDAQSMNQAVFVGDLPFTGVVGAAANYNGNEVIVKTYTDLYYWVRTSGEALSATLAKNPTDTLVYQLEAQGEAVGFANNNSGFFTLSEKGISDQNPNLLFYRRTQ